MKNRPLYLIVIIFLALGLVHSPEEKGSSIINCHEYEFSAVDFTNKEEIEIHNLAKKRLFWIKANRSLPLIITSFALYIPYHFLNKNSLKSIQESKPFSFLSFFISPLLIANIFSDSLKAGLGEANNYVGSIFNKSESMSELDLDLEYQKVLIKYQRNRIKLSSEQKEYIETKLRTVRQRYLGKQKIQHSSFGEPGQDHGKKMLVAIEAVIKLPNQRKPLSFSENLKDKLSSILSSFPEEIQKEVQHAAFSQVSCSKGENRINRNNILLFAGPPGTGKTTLARSYAKALDLPLIEISLAGVKLQDLNGTSFFSFSDEIQFKNLSLLTSSLLKRTDSKGNRYSNAIIFFEEFDKAINSIDWESKQLQQFLLLFLDPSRQKSTLGDIQFDLDISGYTIILAGNQLPKDPALLSRMKLIPFKGYGFEERKAIAWNAFVENNQDLDLDPGVMKDHEEIIKGMASYDPNKGVREILAVVDDFKDHLIQIEQGWTNGSFNFKRAFDRVPEMKKILDEDNSKPFDGIK
ncbi:MAG: AAA family ATPase [Oligoflexales bacterium]